ncbi:hypothetical protein BgiBS90_030174 [Biomphalaria glabrata]|nr:hypothetical protein BgiBS90_030174 [Biomphalaria glabrata]
MMASSTYGGVVPPPLKIGNTRGCESGDQHPPGATPGLSPLSQSATMASRTNGELCPPRKPEKVNAPGGKARREWCTPTRLRPKQTASDYPPQSESAVLAETD